MSSSNLSQHRTKKIKPRGHLAHALSRLIRKKLAISCILTIVALYSIGIFAELLSPYGYTEPDYSQIRKPPSLEHPFGPARR